VLAFPWASPKAAPTILTGASFSLIVGSSRTPEPAAELERRLAGSGRPAFTRVVGRGTAHQVIVGPYVSLDEAESQQRSLARSGLPGARVFVDDSLRNVPTNGRVAITAASPALVLVRAADRVALALELKNEPRQVTARRRDDGTLMVEIGPIDTAIDPQDWSAPDAVDLVQHVSVEEVALTPDTRHARATLTLPPSTEANTRVEGRRVYIDLAREKPPVVPPAASAAPPPPAPRRLAPASRGDADSAADVQRAAAVSDPPRPAGESLQPLVARFERLVPFVQSAARTPAPDVLRALATSVDELDASLRQFRATPDTADAHGVLLSAAAAARRAIDPGSAGDRVAEARHAAMLVEAAKTVLPSTPAR
jgi:hypothetical protein